MGKVGALLVGVLLFAGPGFAHEKRADKCGCHHQYGLRHCHPKKKTNACEAPVKAVKRSDARREQQSRADQDTDDHSHPHQHPNAFAL